jgi:small subunit ribosomal protein S16
MAFFRIVVADSRAPRDGRFIEQLGYYDPLKDPAVINLDTEKAIGWLGKGAQPSETVRALFSRVGIMEIWHEMKKGRSFDELRHIEEDARKKIEARAAMERHKKDEKKDKKQAEVEKETEVAAAAPVSAAPANKVPAKAEAVAETEAETSDESGEAAVEPAEGEGAE